MPNGLLSDGPTNFRNETSRLVARGLHTPHHFTLPYLTWSHAAVEQLGKELFRVSRDTLSELHLAHTSWTDILSILKSALNMDPSPQRGKIEPIKEFTGLDPSQPLLTFLHSDTSETVKMSQTQKERAVNIG